VYACLNEWLTPRLPLKTSSWHRYLRICLKKIFIFPDRKYSPERERALRIMRLRFSDSEGSQSRSSGSRSSRRGASQIHDKIVLRARNGGLVLRPIDRNQSRYMGTNLYWMSRSFRIPYMPTRNPIPLKKNKKIRGLFGATSFPETKIIIMWCPVMGNAVVDLVKSRPPGQ